MFNEVHGDKASPAARITSTIAAALLFANLTLPTALGFLVLPGTAKFDVSAGQFLTFWTVFSTTLFFASPLAGRLIMRLGVRSVVLVSGFVMAAGLVASAYATNFFIFLVSAVPFGVGLAGSSALSATVTVTGWHPPSRRGAILGLAAMGSAIGSVAWGLVLPPIIQRTGFEGGALVCAAGVALFTVAPAVFLLRNPPREVAPEPIRRTASRRRLLNGYFGVTALMMTCVVFFAFEIGFANVQAAVFGSSGFDPATAGLLVSYFAICALITKPILGFLSDRFGSKVLFVVLGVLFLCGLPMLGIFGNLGMGAYLVIIPIASLSMAVPTVTLPLLITGAVGTKRFAVVYGAVFGTLSLSLGFVVPLWGVIYDLTGSWSLPMILAGVMGLLGLVLLAIAYRMGVGRQARSAAEIGAEGASDAAESSVPVLPTGEL